MVFNTTFNNISVIYRGGQFYWWRKPEYPEKKCSKLLYSNLYLQNKHGASRGGDVSIQSCSFEVKHSGTAWLGQYKILIGFFKSDPD